MSSRVICLVALVCRCGQKAGWLVSYWLKYPVKCSLLLALGFECLQYGFLYVQWVAQVKSFLLCVKATKHWLCYSKPSLVNMQLSIQCKRVQNVINCLADTGHVFCGILVVLGAAKVSKMFMEFADARLGSTSASFCFKTTSSYLRKPRGQGLPKVHALFILFFLLWCFVQIMLTIWMLNVLKT